MDIHEKFHEWAREVAKVEVNGIVAHRFEGRGLGIIAERDFKVRRIIFIFGRLMFGFVSVF